MAVDYIKLKSGLAGTSFVGDAPATIAAPASGKPAFPDNAKVGEPLWLKDERVLYIRDSNGRVKSPLPDITQTYNASSEIPVVSAASIPTYQILVQDPNSLDHKRVTISSFGAGGLTDDSKVALNVAGATAGKTYYLDQILLVDSTRGITKTSAGDDSSLTLSISKGSSSQLGVVKSGSNVTIDGDGVLSVGLASAGSVGLASFNSSDFTVSGAGAVTINAGKFLLLNPAANATQTVAGKIIATGPSAAYNVDNDVLVTKAFMLDTVSSWGNKFDFKEAVYVCATTNVPLSTLADGLTINTFQVNTGHRVLLTAQTTTTENGIYVVGATSGATARAGDYNPAAADAATLIGSVIPVVNGSNRGLWMTMSVSAGTASIQPTSNDMSFSTINNTISITGGVGVDQTVQLDVNAGPSLGMVSVGTAGLKFNVRLANGQTGLVADDTGLYLSVVDGGSW